MSDKNKFYIPVLSFLVLTNIVLLAVFVSGIPDNLQSYVCEADRCTLQDWLSATAGWVGFGAASVAAWLVFGQLSEQRKQTAFMLGDAAPTFEQSVSSLPGRRAVFQFINWNRRRADILDVELVFESPNMPRPKTLKIFFGDDDKDDETINFDEQGKMDYALYVPGWIDRSSAPPHMDFEFWFEDKIEDFSHLFVDREHAWQLCLIRLVYEIEDERSEISCRVALVHLLPGLVSQP